MRQLSYYSQDMGNQGITSSLHLCRFPSQRTFDPEDFHAACSSMELWKRSETFSNSQIFPHPEPPSFQIT